jgi:hypothetical protein
MRLSGLVVVALLLSTSLFAQHSSGSGGASSGGYSGGSSSSGSSHSSSSYSSGSSGSSSSHTGSSGSNAGSGGSGSSSSSRARSDRGRTQPEITSPNGHNPPSTERAPTGSNGRTHSPESPSGSKPEKKSFFWFFRRKKQEPKSSSKSEFRFPVRCKKGENCPVCGGGKYPSNAGTCVYQAQVTTVDSCPRGQPWNGFGCGRLYLADNCGGLGTQVEMQKQRVQTTLTTQQQSCSQDTTSRACADGQRQYDSANQLYERLQRQYNECNFHSRLHLYGTVLSPSIP